MNPLHASSRKGSALVLTLMVVSLLIILVLAFSVSVRMQLREVLDQQEHAMARTNARLGVELAIAQLQQFAGPDQRITAPATTLLPSKNFSSMTGDMFTLYRNRAEEYGGVMGPRRTYLTPQGRANFENDLVQWWAQANRQPRWTAVLDASRRRDGTPSNLYGEPDRDQAPHWLVSGNENGTTYTPISDLSDAVEVVGLGSATAAAASVDRLEGRVKAPRVAVAGASAANRLGSYAYWVGDESTKANFAVRDPWFNESNITSSNYRNRLQVPQRIGWERLTGLASIFDNPSNNLTVNDPVFDKVTSSQLIALLNPQFPPRLKENFHHLTAFSRSLFTDTILGGLRKDLTVFFEGSGSGINPNDPVPDRNLYSPTDPRFGGASNNGFPRTAATEGLPTWGQLKSWYDNDQSEKGPVLAHYMIFTAFTHRNGEVQFHILPLIFLWNPYDVPLAQATYRLEMRHNVGFWRFGIGTANPGWVDPAPGVDSAGLANGHLVGGYYISPLTGYGWYQSGSPNFKVRGVDFGTSPTLVWTGNTPGYRFAPFDTGSPKDGSPYPTSADATWVPYRITDSFAPGEVKVFSVMNSQEVNPRNLHLGTEQVVLENGYDPDFPDSYWFTIATGLQKEPGVPPTAADDVRWYGEKFGINSPSTISVRLKKGTRVLWEQIYTGPQDSSRWYTPNPSWDPPDCSNVASNPSTWTKVYEFNQWQVESKNLSDQRRRISPIQAMAGNRLTPFMTLGWQIYDSANGYTQSGLTEYSRLFANYNPSAVVMDPILELDLARAKDAVNNQDRYLTQNLYITARGDRPLNWVADQVDGNKGFALFSWQNYNNVLSTRGLSTLITRQARANFKLLSIGQLQQANIARYFWQPGFTIGNSEASPYVDRARAAGLQSYQVRNATNTQHYLLNMGQRPANTPMTFPNDNRNRFLDLSYTMNEALWDRYFLSSIPQSGPLNTQLANSRVRYRDSAFAYPAELRDFNLAAAHLENVGALNVNSTSVEAWKALLTAFRGLAIEGDGVRNPANTVPISRNMIPVKGPINFTDTTRTPADYGANPSGERRYDKMFQGFRYLTDGQIQRLAERIVDEVRLRGPFYSLADFINRRLTPPDTRTNDWLLARTSNQHSNVISYTHAMGAGYDPFIGLFGLNGALQRAINVSGINGGMNYPFADDSDDRTFWVDRDLSNGLQGDPMLRFATASGYLDSEHSSGVAVGEVGNLLSHSPGFVTQADILAMIGPALTARGDTFVIRGYGDRTDATGNTVQARAYLEVVVQRVPDPVTPAGATGEQRYQPNDRWGRRFEIISQKWLLPEEI